MMINYKALPKNRKAGLNREKLLDHVENRLFHPIGLRKADPLGHFAQDLLGLSIILASTKQQDWDLELKTCGENILGSNRHLLGRYDFVKIPNHHADIVAFREIGRASCRERV